MTLAMFAVLAAAQAAATPRDPGTQRQAAGVRAARTMVDHWSDMMDADEADLARCESLFASVTALGQSLPEASSIEAVVARRQALLDDYDSVSGRLLRREDEEKRLHDSLQLAAMATGIVRIKRRQGLDGFGRTSSEFLRYEVRWYRLDARGRSLDEAREREGNEFGFALAAARQRRALRRGAGWAGGGVLGLLLAAFWTRRRAPAAAAPDPAPPSLPPGFELVGPLGRGGVGEVWAAFDTALQRRAAVKRLRPELTADPRELQRLLAEARIVASLAHPNIVALYSAERQASVLWLVFELVDGETLERTLAKTGRLVPSQALRVLKQCAAALDAAHARGVVHRDLRPANVMLARTGEAKVMDFGLASEAKRTLARLTRATNWGTPAYMAPEQELGAATPAVDTWALAVCCYEMLTGEVPFKGPDFLTQKRERLYAPATTLAPGLPAGLDALFARAFDPDPAKRFPSAGALAAAAAGPA